MRFERELELFPRGEYQVLPRETHAQRITRGTHHQHAVALVVEVFLDELPGEIGQRDLHGCRTIALIGRRQMDD